MKILPVSDSVIRIARLTVQRQKRDFVSSFGSKEDDIRFNESRLAENDA